jgi:hypothetical protein
MPKIERVDVLDDLEYQGGAEGAREVEATETREFSISGKLYRTYLCKANADRFDELFAEWTEFAELVNSNAPRASVRKPGGGGGARRDRTETAKVRAWAKSQNFQPPVSDKGRIPDSVTDAFYAAHPEETRPAPAA